jgi:benzodiazapine receptor
MSDAATRLVTRRSIWVAGMATQAYAAYEVVRRDAQGGRYDVPAFIAYCTQGTLSVAWVLLFIRWQKPGWALAAVGLAWPAAALTVYEFARKHRVAAAVLAPYLVFLAVVFAVTAREVRR